MSEIIKLNNPFRRTERQIISIEPGETVCSIRHRSEITEDLGLDIDVVVSINGVIIPEEQWLTRKVKQNEFLFIMPKVAGGGGDDDGKSILSIAVMLAVVWFAPGAANLLWGGTSTIAVGGAGVWMTSVAIVVGGAMLVSALSPHPKRPSSGFLDDEQSQVFGWNPTTIQRQGITVPRFYGLNKLYGNVVACHTEKEVITFTETTIQEAFYYERQWRPGFWETVYSPKITQTVKFDPRKVTLYALFNLGIGPIRDVVVEGTMKLNDQSVENFDFVFYETRKGNLHQEAISYFENTKLEVVVGRLVENGNPVIYETSNANFHNLEIELSFPNGLFNGEGADLANNTVNVTVEVKKTTAATWETLVDGVNITDNVGNKVIVNYPTEGNINIEYGSNYQIRVTKNTSERDNIRFGDGLYIDKVREVIDIAFTKPRRAMVGIKVLATNQLYGSIRFSCYSRGLYVIDFTDSASSIIYSNNPALVIYDILTQPVFSGLHSPWLDLVLLLNFEGADTATETVDDSSRGHTVNFTGTAQLDTGEQKFDIASLLLDGNSDDVNMSSSGDWRIFANIVEDWTVDIEVKFANHVDTEYIITHYEDDDNRWYLYHLHGTGLVFKNVVGGVEKISITAAAGEISDTNWHHIALIKVGALIGLYLDGTQVGYDLMAEADVDIGTVGSLFIGQQGDNTDWFQGNIYHVRIIKSNIFDALLNDTPDD